MDIGAQFTSHSCDNLICLQWLQQVQEALTYQVTDGKISVRTVLDNLLFIQPHDCQLFFFLKKKAKPARIYDKTK